MALLYLVLLNKLTYFSCNWPAVDVAMVLSLVKYTEEAVQFATPTTVSVGVVAPPIQFVWLHVLLFHLTKYSFIVTESAPAHETVTVTLCVLGSNSPVLVVQVVWVPFVSVIPVILRVLAVSRHTFCTTKERV